VQDGSPPQEGSARSGPASLIPVSTDFLAGGGELGELIRNYDWSATALGPPSAWPQSLGIAIRIMLTSRQPIWIGWGEDLTYFYNDPYKSIIGGKHPWALGRPAREVWREIWGDIGPMLAIATAGDQGTYVESQLLIMERHGYPEETYYTFSYSPIPNGNVGVGGIICANSDDTQRVIGERQLALLRELAADAGTARTWREACERSAQALSTNPRDLPFAMIYIAEPDSNALALVGTSGIEPGHPAAPHAIPANGSSAWPFAEVLRTHDLRLVSDLAIFGDLPKGAWHLQPTQAAVIPIQSAGETGRAGVLVLGLNPFRLYDEDYRSFLTLAAGQIAVAIANAQAYEEQRRRSEALAELDRAKTTFFSNVSHEFRTPLTLMLGPIEDALNDRTASQLSDIQRGRLELAHRNSLRLLKLVNSLLDFSRIEAGQADASFEPTNLAELTAALASSFQSATQKAGLGLRLDCRLLPAAVYVDREMWEKIVLNLISNAFKFTFDGEIAVQLSVDRHGTAALLIVSDTGVGIPENELSRLFERFHRVEGQRSRSFEGSGIGLALVQELVGLHGGTIEVASKVGAGTTFTVMIPFGTAHLPRDRIGAARSRASTSLRAEAYIEEALRWLPDSVADSPVSDRNEEVEQSLARPRTSSLRVLVAEDNADMREYVRRLLANRWSIEAVANGEAAITSIRKQKPDLLLSDVMMPVMDGFELLREIRFDPTLRDLPVILLSARAGEEARVGGLDAGADDYLTKPFSARELIARVNTNLELARIRREATLELQESESRFRNMADHAPVMMWVSDATGACTYFNRLWREFTGLAIEQSLGFGVIAVVHPDDRADVEQVYRDANENTQVFRLEHRIRRADGSYRWVLGAATPRFDGAGEFLGYIGSIVDVTDLKGAEQVLQQANEHLERRVSAALAERADAEAKLRQAQKMESIGKLTGGVAHDFNNVLQIIGGNLQLVAKDVAGNLRAEQRLQTALAGVFRGSKLASQLLAFSGRAPLAPKVVNLGRLVRGIDDMLSRAIGEGVEVETIIVGGLWNTYVDATQVENALLNLAINSRDAMNGQGKLTIEVGNAFLDDDYVARYEDVNPGQYVVMAVTDTGCGIATEMIDLVFEPFFTTKPEGQGTGLGLSVVYGFIKQSGGHMKIYSEVGQGTTVRIYLPRVREQEDVETDVETEPPTGGTETVLVVEDDEDVRSTVVEMLSDLGYRVLKAKDAPSALAIVESGVPIDLLFTDVVMPGSIRSTELARKARERLPDIAVLFTSGYTENSIVHGGRLDEGVDLLSKPYTREALARKLRHSLRNQHQSTGSAELGSGIIAQSRSALELPAQSVLLVEDDAVIRYLTAEMLKDLGQTVLQASDATEALVLLGRHKVDMLITDVKLPGMSGDVLARKARARRPELPVIFASGYDLPSFAVDDDVAGMTILRKPYDIDALRAAVIDATKADPQEVIE
jgi:PAS domain S-box-containing protein